MRLLVDECVVGYVIGALRSFGADVVAVSEVMPGIDDEQVLQMSVDQQRILVSDDYGFGELVFRLGRPAVAVVLIAPGTIEKDIRQESLKVARRILDQADSLLGKLTILEAERIRHRPLIRK